MQIRWFGTAAIGYTERGKSIIFDPFCGRNKKLGVLTAADFAGRGNIFITHGHFDHVMDVPAILREKAAFVYCSAGVARNLIRRGLAARQINIIEPGNNISDGPFKITALEGRHISFDSRLIRKTIFNLRVIRHFGSFLRILKAANEFKDENILVYYIEAGKKKLLHMGSLNLALAATYPHDVDIFALPYQGRSDLASYALPIVAKINPRTVFLHHFDDTFPPISSNVKTETFIRNLTNKFPDLKLIIPQRGEELTV